MWCLSLSPLNSTWNLPVRPGLAPHDFLTSIGKKAQCRNFQERRTQFGNSDPGKVGFLCGCCKSAVLVKLGLTVISWSPLQPLGVVHDVGHPITGESDGNWELTGSVFQRTG